MRLKISLLLLLAAALAFGAGLVSFFYLEAVDKELRRSQSALKAYGEVVSLPVLARAVEPQELVTSDDFSTISVPLSYAPSNALRAAPTPEEGETLVALRAIGAGAVLLSGDLALRPAGAAAPLRLTDGRAAGGFEIANFAALAPVLSTGATVDLFLYQPGDKAASPAQPITAGETLVVRPPSSTASVRLIASAVEVMDLPEAHNASGNQPENERSKVVLLAGPPQDIARALLAGQSGELHLVLSGGQLPLGIGPLIVGAADLAALPLASRAPSVHSPGVTAPIPGTVPAAIISSETTRAPAASGRVSPQENGCKTVVVRASERVEIEVPC